jgi:hypothetical protein
LPDEICSTFMRSIRRNAMSRIRLAASLLCAMVLVACTASQPQVVRPTGTTVYPPTQFVEVLDSAPSRPYVEIGVIDVPGEPGALRAQVLAQVQASAQQIGADAVILRDTSRQAPTAPRLNPTTGQYDTTGGQLIPSYKGIAIKYKQ